MPLYSLKVQTLVARWKLFVVQAPQFSWTTQFRNGYCTVCVDTTAHFCILFAKFILKLSYHLWVQNLAFLFYFSESNFS